MNVINNLLNLTYEHLGSEGKNGLHCFNVIKFFDNTGVKMLFFWKLEAVFENGLCRKLGEVGK